jgi:hypothetical protein
VQKYKPKLILVSLLLIMSSVPANSAALTWFSRANCGVPFPYTPLTGLYFNESVSWTGITGPSYVLHTFSNHNLAGYALQDGSNWLGYHYENSGLAYTWRSYAGDVTHGAPFPTWYVHGNHWYINPYLGVIYLGYTFATGCNITQW